MRRSEMTWLGWSLVIFLTALVTLLGTAWLTGRKPGTCDQCGHEAGWCRCPCCQARVPLARLADPAPLPGELPVAGYFDLPDTLARLAYCRKDMHLLHRIGECPYDPPGTYGPFPVDTGPLLILSEQAAAEVALEREIRQRCAEAEAKIPPRWR